MQSKNNKQQNKNYSEKEIPRRRDKRNRDNYYDETPKNKYKDDEYDEEYEVDFED